MALATTNIKHKTISPYDLTSGDNPGAVISQPLLNGSNYDEWALNLRIALSSRKKFGFLDGSIPKPGNDSSNFEDWIANNHLIVGWIKLTIEPKLRSSISTREVAHDMWEIIKKRFSIKSGARLQQLRNALATCKQSGTSVDDYFGRLTKLWDGIAECTNSKRCECGKCECDLNTSRDKELEILKIHDFLSGLDDGIHGVIRSQICAITPLPDLDSVYQTILQNETIHAEVVKDAELMSFASQLSLSSKSSNSHMVRDTSNSSGFSRDNTKSGDVSRFVPGNRDPNRKCSACGKSGHESSSCFKVIGYPDWWEERPRRNNSRGVSTTGRGRGSQPRANNTEIVSANAATTSYNPPLTDADRQGFIGFTDEHWRTIQRVYGPGNTNERLSGKNNGLIWILDMGATHHMTGRANLMQDIRTITPVSVRLPAGENVLSSEQGTIHLTSRLCLKIVYLIPGFNANLISLGQLLTNNFLVGQMSERLLVLQDRSTRTLIGIGGHEEEGLYRF